MAAKTSKVWHYGTSPNPNTWQETADAITSMASPKKTTSIPDRLDAIERLLKEKK